MRIAPLLLLGALTAVTAGCGKTPPAPPTDSDAPAAPGGAAVVATAPTGDLAKAQGKWAVTKLEIAPGGDSPEIKPVSDADLKKVEVVIANNLLKVRVDPEWEPRYYVLVPQAGKTPAAIDLVESDTSATTAPRSVPTAKDGKMTTMNVPRERLEAIYKFEGNTLVVAVPLDFTTRPTEFKPAVAAAGSRKVPVVIAHLKMK